jgi:hypothetical protein
MMKFLYGGMLAKDGPLDRGLGISIHSPFSLLRINRSLLTMHYFYSCSLPNIENRFTRAKSDQQTSHSHTSVSEGAVVDALY